MTLRMEIGIAGALGTLIGLTVGWSMGWNLFLSALIGIPAAFLCYRPGEILAVSRSLAGDMGRACCRVFRRGDTDTQWVRKVCRYAGNLLLTVFSLSLLPAAGTLLIIVVTSCDAGTALVASLVVYGCGVCLGMIYQPFLGDSDFKTSHWAFPLSRHILYPGVSRVWSAVEPWRPEGMMCRRDEPTWEEGRFVVVFVLLLAGTGVVLLPFAIIDTCVTLVLALAVTERIAAMLGAATGCIAGACMAYLVALHPLAFLSAGAVCGYYAGSGAYAVREWIAALPASVQ